MTARPSGVALANAAWLGWWRHAPGRPTRLVSLEMRTDGFDTNKGKAMKRILFPALVTPIMLLTAAPAGAAVGVTATFNPTLTGMDVTINNVEPQFAKQCAYSAQPQQPTLLQPVDRPFALPPGGSTTISMPGIPTGTTWRVNIVCDYTGAVGDQTIPQGRSGGSLEQNITY